MPLGARIDPVALGERLVAGDRVALAKAISLVEDRDPAAERLIAAVFSRTGGARMIGLTGPPGVGKSTLAGALTSLLRSVGRGVAVLSVDPSSPYTNGAVLGDRIRLAEHFLDPAVFIRSMASRGASGGLSESALQAALLLDAAGHDDVLIETVGVGQGEVDVAGHADTIVLALMPGSGDSVQALKAGVMEIPDVIVINKRDHPQAEATARDVRAALTLGPAVDWDVPVILTEATTGAGVDELLVAIDRHAEYLASGGELERRRAASLRREVLAIALADQRRALARRAEGDARLRQVLSDVAERRVDPARAARLLLETEADA